MNSLSSHLFRAAALALALPVFGMCAAVTITAPQVTYGTETDGTTSTPVTIGSDTFTVTSFYSTSYDSAGTHLTFVPTATLTSGPNLAASDTITIDYLSTIYDNSPGNWDGTYTEHVPLYVSNIGSASGQLFVDGQGLPLEGFTGPGGFYASASSNLTGLDSSTLSFDYQFVFTFGAGSTVGDYINSPTPEPAQTIPAAIGLVGFALVGLRRRKK